MPILEKIAQPLQARHWTDSIPLEFHYTAGVAGEKFRRELKENGKFLISTCAKCKTRYIPARMFCPSCFIEMKETHSIDDPGYVYSHTTVKRNRAGEASENMTLALVKFQGIEGGIVHKLDESTASGVTFGTKVLTVLKDEPERTGALSDIVSFKRA